MTARHELKTPLKRRVSLLVAGIVALGSVGGAVALSTTANASVPTPVAGNVVVLPAAPRVVPSPGTATTANVTKTFQISGESFSGIAIPANTTGVTVSISSLNPSAAGKLTVWTHEAGKPGTGAVSFAKGESATNLAFVGLNSEGKLDVQASVATNFVLAIQAYVVPLTPVAAPVVKLIAPVEEKVLAHIGVSVRNDNPSAAGSGATDLGSVALDAGTYDVNVSGGFKGLNSSSDLPAGVQLFGGLFLTNSATITTGFSEVLLQNQGVQIPRATGTLTVDPTVPIVGQIKLTAPTTVHVLAYAYAGDSVDHSALGLKANVRNATFTKVG
jgi:hypothetical protein